MHISMYTDGTEGTNRDDLDSGCLTVYVRKSQCSLTTTHLSAIVAFVGHCGRITK